MLSYSKGSRGLFVPSRVIGIFTDTTISLSSRLRQCPDHYTIRAGRNLPDKEFRYLRTVIVTADIHEDLGSELRRSITKPPNKLPSSFRIGHVSRPIRCFINLAERCAFVKQSQSSIYCRPPCGGHPFSRSYGAILPSSLERFLSRALEYSSHPPVSVYGTGELGSTVKTFLGKGSAGSHGFYSAL